MEIVAIALGSNLGDRRRQLDVALQQLRCSFSEVLASAYHETAPVDAPGPAFLNGAATARTLLSPRAVLDVLVAIENVYVLPGVPEIFRRKLEILRAHLTKAGAPFVSRAAYTRMDEALLKPLLDEVVAGNPEVEVGSYPRWNDPTYETKVTFDGNAEEAVERALQHFLKLLPPGEPQWTE